MNFKIWIFFAVFGALTSCNQKRETVPVSSADIVFENSQPSFVKITKKDGKFNYEKSETRFDIVELAGKEPQKLLISITQKENREFSQDAEAQKEFTISVKNFESPESEWKKDVTAAEIDYSEDVISALKSPLENWEEYTYVLYNIRNGDEIMNFTYGKLTVGIPNTSDKRFFGYLSKNNSYVEKIEEGGIIEYASTEKLIEKFSIKSKGTIQIPNYTPDIQALVVKDADNLLLPDGKKIILAKLNSDYKPKDIANFAFQVTYFSQDGQTQYKLIFPVENDKIDLRNAIYDKSLFEVREL